MTHLSCLHGKQLFSPPKDSLFASGVFKLIMYFNPEYPLKLFKINVFYIEVIYLIVNYVLFPV